MCLLKHHIQTILDVNLHSDRNIAATSLDRYTSTLVEAVCTGGHTRLHLGPATIIVWPTAVLCEVRHTQPAAPRTSRRTELTWERLSWVTWHEGLANVRIKMRIVKVTTPLTCETENGIKWDQLNTWKVTITEVICMRPDKAIKFSVLNLWPVYGFQICILR